MTNQASLRNIPFSTGIVAIVLAGLFSPTLRADTAITQAVTSVVTSNPANGGYLKTGQ
jgi:hypothetical protein